MPSLICIDRIQITEHSEIKEKWLSKQFIFSVVRKQKD